MAGGAEGGRGDRRGGGRGRWEAWANSSVLGGELEGTEGEGQGGPGPTAVVPGRGRGLWVMWAMNGWKAEGQRSAMTLGDGSGDRADNMSCGVACGSPTHLLCPHLTSSCACANTAMCHHQNTPLTRAHLPPLPPLCLPPSPSPLPRAVHLPAVHPRSGARPQPADGRHRHHLRP